LRPARRPTAKADAEHVAQLEEENQLAPRAAPAADDETARLELLSKALVPVLAQPDEQLGSTDPLNDRPLSLRQLSGATPGSETHRRESASSKC